jgi:molecular chaperone Hsp33
MSTAAQDAKRLHLPSDNVVIVFRTELSGIQGRLVRIGAVADTIIAAHQAADPASAQLGDALAVAALIGSALAAGSDTDGTISLHTKTDGPISILYADSYTAPFDSVTKLRGYVRFDAPSVATMAESDHRSDRSIGDGTLAITIDRGAEQRYQGVVAIEQQTLADAVVNYFVDRENLPTYLTLASAPLFRAGAAGASPVRQWRVGGLMMQQKAAPPDGDEDAWPRVRMLAATVEDHELLDATQPVEQLLLQLFHEEGVRIERVVPLASYCKCSREKVANVLKSFSQEDIADVRDEAGKIAVKCEFCATSYSFDAADFSSVKSSGH